MMVTSGENSISLEWCPPSEVSPLSYTVTWTGRGVTSSVTLPPTARNYTIRGLDSNTEYSSTVEVYSLANNARVSRSAHTLPQGERVCISALVHNNMFLLQCKHASNMYNSTLRVSVWRQSVPTAHQETHQSL